MVDFADLTDINATANHGYQVVDSGFIMFFVGFVAVSLRFVCRRLLRNPYLLDDWLVVMALFFSSFACFTGVYSAIHDKLGQHMEKATPETLTTFFITLFIFEVAYPLAIAFSKWSILALYWRIFHVKYSFKITLIFTTLLTGAWLIVSVFVTIFGCSPVQAFWEVQLQAEGAKCIVSSSFSISQGSTNIAIDVILLVLPLIMISTLQMSQARKVAISFIFVLGGMTTICSVLRLWRLVLTTEAVIVTDVTWQSVGLIVFSVIEMNLSILCACLPSMSPLLRLTISSSLRSETHDSPAYYNASSTISTREGISVKSSLKSQRKWSRVVGNMRRIMFLGRSNANSANSKEDMQLPIIHRSYTVNTITGVSETQSDVDKRSNWQESIATQELDIGRLGEPKNRAETTTTALRH